LGKNVVKTPVIFLVMVLMASGLLSCAPGPAHRSIKKDVSMDTITLQPHHPYAIDDRLTITVLGIGEIIYAPDRRTEIEISLHMKTREIEKDIGFTSGEPALVWEGYEFEYLGGWTSEVRLRLKQTPFGSRK
jgi:hypothetical protein